MDENVKTTPMSRELMEHVRNIDYDGQGKSLQRESDDSMWIIGYMFLAVATVAVIVAVLLIMHAYGWS